MRNDPPRVTEILLVGNPNAGKSTLFNALTGGHAKVGNWHGVTVGVLTGEAVLGGKRYAVSDLPGIYSTNGMSMEERAACDYIAAKKDAFLLFVCECATLPRALPLFQELSRGRKCALVLTKRRLHERAGGFVDPDALSRELGVPVVESGRKRGELRDVIARLIPLGGELRGALDKGFRPAREGLSRADRLLTNGFLCLPLFCLLLLFAFYVTFAPGMPGAVLKGGIEFLFDEVLGGYAARVSSPVLRGFLSDGLLSGLGGVLCFLPQIVLLFFFLLMMEESGFLSRLAVLCDGFLARLGLNGRAVFSLVMGFGCTAAAILTTRGLDDKQVQKRVILCLPYISCSAKLPVFLTLSASFFSDPFVAVVLLYLLGVGLSLTVALFLKRGETPFVLELAPLQVPRPEFIAKALLLQLKQFIIKLATVIFAFFLASWLLSSFDWGFRYCGAEESMLASVCGGLKYLFAPIGCCDWKIAYAALSGLVAKENVAGALAMFYGGFPYSPASAFSFAVFLLACSPCVSAIAASAKELGWKRSLLYAAAQTVSALLLSYLVYFLLTGGGRYLVPLLIPAALLLLWKRHEKIRRKRADHPQKVYR